MNILHILSSLDPKAGGVSQAVRSIVKYSSNSDLHHEILCLDDLTEDYIQNETFIIHALGKGKTAWSYHPKLKPWLRQNLAKYDKIIVHGLWQYHTYALYSVWKQINVNKPELYVMPHGMLDPYFQKASGRKLKAVRNWLFWKLIEQKIVNRTTGLLFTCEIEKLLARETFAPYHPKAEFVIGLGVEQPPIFQEKMKISFFEKLKFEPKSFILFIGRIDPKKGVDLLVNAYNKLCLEDFDLPHLVIAGPGLDTNYGKRIIELSKQNKRIIFPGMLGGDAKWGAFYGCEAFILPSHQENFGIAVVEALACGKPVLISNKVNIWKEIEEAGGGLVDEDTEEGTGKLIRAWINLEAADKKEMSVNARDVYKDKFSIDPYAVRFKSSMI